MPVSSAGHVPDVLGRQQRPATAGRRCHVAVYGPNFRPRGGNTILYRAPKVNVPRCTATTPPRRVTVEAKLRGSPFAPIVRRAKYFTLPCLAVSVTADIPAGALPTP